MSFAKLDSGIVNSTIWVQPADVLKVWVWFLSQCDANGVVRTAAPPLAHACMVPLDRMREILALLESPDPDSRTSTDEGRRIEKIEGGWRIVNYGAYREKRDEEATRERKREWDREHRPSGHARAKQSASSPMQSDQSDSKPTSPTKAEAEEEVEAGKQDQKIGAPRKRSATPQGTRLPADWQPSADDLAFAARERPDIDAKAEADKFRDYWHGRAGKEARKADWPATWRNWIRKADVPRGARAGPQPTQPAGKQVQGLMALEGMKSGNRMAAGRVGDGVPEALLLGAGTHSGG